MPFHPNNETHFKRLKNAKDYSFKQLEPFRENRMIALRQLVGPHYGPREAGVPHREPANFIELAMNIYLRRLASSAPTVLWHATQTHLRPIGASVELLHNRVLQEMNFKEELRFWVMEAFVGAGFLKVGLTPAGEHEEQGFLRDAGRPFAGVVFLDDWVHDMSAKRYQQVQFAGNKYQVPTEDLARRYKLSEVERARLKAQSDLGADVLDEMGGERAAGLSQGQDATRTDQLVPLTDVWDLWLPREKLVITLNDVIDRPLKVIRWTGHEMGPYHRLGFEEVPGNVMPLPPVAVMRDLHDLANSLYIKLGQQAQKQKSNVGYRGGAEKDAERLKNALDSEYILMNDPEALRAFKSGGIDQSTLAMFLTNKDLFSWLMGNLDALGGLSPQSGTLGQDELLSSAASRRLEDMRDRLVESTQRVQEAIGAYIWDDPVVDRTITKRIGGPGPEGIDIPMRFAAELREGDLKDFDIEILPNSMENLTSGERMRLVTNVVQTFVIPLVDRLAAQGVQLNARALFEMISRYHAVPEVRDIVTIGPPPTLPRGESRALQSPSTTRTNIRKSVPGASRSGKDEVMTKALIGAGSQPSEVAAVSRPTG